MKKSWLMAPLLAALLTSTAAAGDLADAAKDALPPMFSLQMLAGEEKLHFLGADIPYEAGELVADMKRADTYLTGYIFSGKAPDAAKEALAPYFRYKLSENELAGLAALNKAFFDETAPLHKAVVASFSAWAESMAPGAGATMGVTLSRMEPLRRVEGENYVLYTAGTGITLSSGGLILPLYGRAYMYKDGDGYRFVMLVAGDDSRRPLTYALEDLAKEAAARAAKRNLQAFVAALPVH